MIRLRARALRALGDPYVCSSCLLSLANRSVHLRPTTAGLIRSSEPASCRFYASGRRKRRSKKSSQSPSLDTEAGDQGKDENGPASTTGARELVSGGPGSTTGESQSSSGTILQQLQRAASDSEDPSTAAVEAPPTDDVNEDPETPKKRKPQRLIKLMSKSKDSANDKNMTEDKKDEDKKTEEKKAPKRLISKKRRSGKEFKIQEIKSKSLELTAIECQQPPVPRLSYGLDRVLFNSGVYDLQDPRSKVYNFDPYLAEIMPIQEFDFNALKQYITSSKDNALISIAAEHGKKYAGSTSSMTSMLAHFHFLLSAWRPINIDHMSRSFTVDSTNFTRINRSPAAVFLHYKDGTYAIDADKEFDTANILSMLGKSMEKLLTLPKEEYEKYRRVNSDQISDEQRNEPEAYHYTTMGDFMMRSQLDAYDPRVKGSGMFDLKTRSVVSIRMDAKDFHKGLGYELRHRFGQWESYEREYYDMIRSAFLKYSLQVRMGRMDGIFVAFHNTQRIFGFQYISLGEMDRAIHGSETAVGDHEFKLSLRLLNEVFDKATKRFPKQSLRLHFETRPSDTPFMYVFAKPVTSQDIEEVQGASKAAIDEFERNILGLGAEATETCDQDSDLVEDQETGDIEASEGPEAALEESEEDTPESGDQATYAAWGHMLDKVEETLDKDEQGIGSVREAIEDAMEQVGLLRAHSSEETRRYLDNMLEAITGRTVFPEARTPSPEGQESTSTEAEDYEVEQLLTGSTEGSGEPIEGDDAPAPETTRYAQEALTTASSTAAESPTLKELILKLAQSPSAVTEYREGESQAQNNTLGQMKLRKFGEILSELRAKSQEQIQALPEEQAAEADSEAAAADNTDASPSSTSSDSENPNSEVLGMVLTIKNKLNGSYVTRPEHCRLSDTWTVEYSIEEMPPDRASRHYEMMLARRKKLLSKLSDGDDDSNRRTHRWLQMFRGDLEKYSVQGRKYRARMNSLGSKFPVHVYGVDKPLNWEDVFRTSKAQAEQSGEGDGKTTGAEAQGMVEESAVKEKE